MSASKGMPIYREDVQGPRGSAADVESADLAGVDALYLVALMPQVALMPRCCAVTLAQCLSMDAERQSSLGIFQDWMAV